ncbi:MAG: bifunctional adenosylcobinamide kinase/adenosylcobinamide-phosphate guanylyltransferase [Oscillospiraceae bacterium]|jgi:adenosylcobinamide kinase/adenosylcobinamide-phosphate guanylyltransferase
MLTIITGSAGSGKSELAEKIITKAKGQNFYIATMIPSGSETEKRIERHRLMRAEKHFETVEKYTNISSLNLPKGCNVLLECMSNLCANEIFSQYSCDKSPEDRILKGIDKILTRASHLAIVTNEVFSDGIQYDSDTVGYIEALGKINSRLAKKADNVIECVYGIPVILKGKLL